MATGDTLVNNVSDALNVMVASARMVRDYDAVVPKTVDRQRLAENTGLSWIEDRVELLEAPEEPAVRPFRPLEPLPVRWTVANRDARDPPAAAHRPSAFGSGGVSASSSSALS